MKTREAFVYPGIFIFGLVIWGCAIEPDKEAVSTDGVKIAFNQQGKGNPAIVFIPGWTNPKTIWDDQLAHFSEKYNTIAIDLAGTGESGNQRDSWTMTNFGYDVVSVINTLRLQEVVLVGFSMGAAVAVETANLLPEKVVGVVLVDDLQDPDVKYPPEMVAFMDSVLMDLVLDITNEKLLAFGFYRTNPEENFNRILSLYPDTISQTGWHESLLNYFAWRNENCVESLKKLKVPVTAVNSDMEPTNVEAFKKYVPSFEAKIIPGVGHLLFWENSGEFNRLLEESIQEFLQE